MRKVMVVDDSSGVRKFVKYSLRVRNYKVITAEDGLDALEKLKDQEIDLLLTDLNMPNLDGYSLIKKIRDSEDYTNLPIIILTSEEDEKEKNMGFEAGANEYLVKPFKPEKVIKLVDKYLK